MQEIFTRLYILFCHEYYPVTQLEISNVICAYVGEQRYIRFQYTRCDIRLVEEIARRRKRYKKIYFQTDLCSCYLPVEVYPTRFI